MEIYLTVHAKRRMRERAISEDEIIEALINGIAVRDKENPLAFVIDYGKVRIVFRHSGEHVIVITTMPSRAFRKQLRKYVKMHKISYRQATKRLKNVI